MKSDIARLDPLNVLTPLMFLKILIGDFRENTVKLSLTHSDFGSIIKKNRGIKNNV